MTCRARGLSGDPSPGVPRAITGVVGTLRQTLRGTHALLPGTCARAGEKKSPEMIQSDVADMKNSGGRWGGAIPAALFLREFVDEGIPWAHLDIAGPALVESDRPYRPAGGTGVMARTILRYLEEQ